MVAHYGGVFFTSSMYHRRLLESKTVRIRIRTVSTFNSCTKCVGSSPIDTPRKAHIGQVMVVHYMVGYFLYFLYVSQEAIRE